LGAGEHFFFSPIFAPPAAKFSRGSSSNSFIPGHGPKPKEGFIEKLTGGRREQENSFLLYVLTALTRKYHKKWILVGESYVAYYANVGDQWPEEVLLCDPYFDVSYKYTLGRLGISVDNSYRKLFFTCQRKVPHSLSFILVPLVLTSRMFYS